MPKILLVRHGQTALNGANRFCGHTDAPLSESGVVQVEKLRDKLSKTEIDAVYASDLGRARQTAGIIVGGRDLDMVPCPELREVDFGEFEGMTFDEIAENYPEMARELRRWSITPRFPGGESIAEFDQRVASFLPRLAKHSQKETVLVVGHSGSVRLLICDFMRLELEYWRKLRIDLASLTVINTYPETGGAIMNLMNDICHLDGEVI